MANSAKNKLAASVAQQWPAAAAGRFSVEAALSGGLDSVVLLHILHSLRGTLPLELSAVHVHHGLSALADDWVVFCRQLCARWQIPLRVEYVRVASAGLGWEAAARAERYRCFAASPANIVALAHHADDQIETFMLAALRGGGLRALAAMPAQRDLGAEVRLWRPLLAFPRQALEEYAREHRLDWIEDDSNQDTTLLRNWLRLEGLPPWQQRVPHFVRQLPAAIAQLQRDLALLEEYAAADWAAVHDAAGRFHVARWRSLSPLRRERQLYAFARNHRLGTPTAASVADFAATLSAPATQQAEWPLPQGRAVYYGNLLYAADAAVQPIRQLLSGSLTPEWQTAVYGLPESLIRHGHWRPVSAQDRLPLRGGGHKSVRRLLQERRVPPFLRPLWPVWSDTGNRCLAVAQLAVCPEAAVAGGYVCRIPELAALLPVTPHSV
ncbi:MAG: tRNA lysidine(34) synthetase TilS [Eikenella sp.]|nr:tRNA lysidine(34) synthetase TilS [Eikenella sp.]